MKKQENVILRRLYSNEGIVVDGRAMEVHELVQNANFATMFGSLSNDLEKLWMTVEQREAFCEKYRETLLRDGYSTLFLHKDDKTAPAIPGNLIVARVSIRTFGLYAPLARFEYDREWSAEGLPRPRVVVPQLAV